jgi:hypothetical protein
MSKLGKHCVYTVPVAHHTNTIKKPHGEAGKELEGSTHHAELREFAGLVTREHAPAGKKKAETFDIVIFPPGKAPVHVEGVLEGKDAGEIQIHS